MAALDNDSGLRKQGREPTRTGEAGERREARPVNDQLALSPCSQRYSCHGKDIMFDYCPTLTKGKLELSDI